jgi:Xaa-Pro aminopeptidase
LQGIGGLRFDDVRRDSPQTTRHKPSPAAGLCTASTVSTSELRSAGEPGEIWWATTPRLGCLEDVADQTEIARQLERRRCAAAAEWQLTDEIVLIGAGDLIAVPGRGDRTYPFQAHSEYYYLTDRNRPGGVLAFDPQAGWFDFTAPITDSDRLWSGAPTSEPDELTTAVLGDWLGSRANRPLACLGVAEPDVPCNAQTVDDLRAALDRVRRPKDSLEVERMRVAERATGAAFAAAVPLLRDGISERGVQIELEAAAFRGGGDAMAYDTIIGGGKHSAILHFAPTTRPLRTGELVLIDAGAEYRGYASDITRTYPVNGRFGSDQQRELHSVVRAAELAAIERCMPGIEWRDVHLTAALVIAEGLVAGGLLRGQPESLVEAGAASLFFPHGVGHLVGLGVRDAGGMLPERRGNPPPFPNLRIDLPLKAGMVVTVEPGIYFVPALLQDPERRSRHRDEVAWSRVDRMLDFGGIRIEDNVLITETEHEVITRDVPLLG